MNNERRAVRQLRCTQLFMLLLIGSVAVVLGQEKGYASRDRRRDEMSLSQSMANANNWSALVGFSRWSAQDSSYRYSSKKSEIRIATPSGYSLVLNTLNGNLIMISNNRRATQRHGWNGTERGRRFSTAEAENNYALSIVHALEPESVHWTARFSRKVDGHSQGPLSDNCGYFAIMVNDGNGHIINIDFDSKDGQVLDLAWLHGKTPR